MARVRRPARGTCSGMARERVWWPSVVDRAREIVNGYAPMKVTLGQVMYRLASEGTLPHTAPMCRRLSAQLARARREGRFPDLIDTVRQVHVPPAWTGADAVLAEMPDWFRLDRTEGARPVCRDAEGHLASAAVQEGCF